MALLFEEESYKILGACFDMHKATGHRLGFLVNFGHYPKLEYERIVR